MAQLKTNKKAFDTEVKIYKSLRRLLLTKTLDEITVADIASECGVSRSSFYRSFKSIPDVLEAIFDWFYKRYLDNRRSQLNQLQYFFQYWINHKDLVKIIAQKDIQLIKNCITRYDERLLENQLLLDVKATLFVSTLTYWSNNSELTIDSMISYTKEAFEKRNLEIILL